VFEPYTPIATNILFFDRSGPTKHVWYFEQPLPEGRKKYSKTSPLLFEEFSGCMKWWKSRREGDLAWRVPAEDLISGGCNLDISNPRGGASRPSEPPHVLIAHAIDHERTALECLERIAKQLRPEGTG
jgi:type I restriction enzyme M protein